MQTISRNLSRYRNELKGIAILWVVFFHAQLGLSGLLYEVQRIGYGGVDIFFFLSGFGLYHSLEKDADLGRYLKRRAERLLPAYLPFCLVWLVVMIPMYNVGMATAARVAMSNLTMLGFLTGSPYYINWYTGALLVSLILAPFFYQILKPGKRYWLRAISLLVVLFAAGMGYIDDGRYMAISRLPLMAIGMIAAGCSISPKRGRMLSAALCFSLVLGLLVLYSCLNNYHELLVTYAMYWHPFVLITPALCFGLSWLFSHINTRLLKPLRFFGEASFEIFLFNAWVEVFGVRFGMITSAGSWLVWSIASIAAGCAYHWMIGAILKRRHQKI